MKSLIISCLSCINPKISVIAASLTYRSRCPVARGGGSGSCLHLLARAKCFADRFGSLRTERATLQTQRNRATGEHSIELARFVIELIHRGDVLAHRADIASCDASPHALGQATIVDRGQRARK